MEYINALITIGKHPGSKNNATQQSHQYELPGMAANDMQRKIPPNNGISEKCPFLFIIYRIIASH